MTRDHSPELEQLLSRVDADRLMETTRTVAQWERISGSDDERQAFDYLQKQLTELGWRTERHEPVCLVSLPVRASLKIVGIEELLPCITHSFSTSTDDGGVDLELVYAGKGNSEDYTGINALGKAVLVEGLALPNKVAPAESAGAAAVIHNSGAQIHEMTISPVWGSPTTDTIRLLPKIPHVSIDQNSSQRLRELMKNGPVRIHLATEVDTRWRPLPVLIADIPRETDDGIHVLLSGHVDSWYYGAMDNGSANAAMLECARLMSGSDIRLRRGLRLAYWSGHSHARYATSTWYADQYWQTLHNYCVGHVNIDSPGGIGATNLTAANTMAETYPLARVLFKSIAGADLHYERIGRLGDQSFWGAGVPSFYCSISQQPEQESPTGISALTGRGGGLGWWWHTADDTIDKIDPEFLARDARILLATVYRLCTDERLPYSQAEPAREILDELRELQSVGGEDLTLDELIGGCQQLIESAQEFDQLELDQPVDEDELRLYNGSLIGVSRILLPINYTVSGAFEHDLALGASVLPGLQPMRGLPELRDSPDQYYGLLNKLRRERNRVQHGLSEARTLIDQTLAVFRMDA